MTSRPVVLASSVKMTEFYAERDREQAREIARAVG